MNYLAIDWGEKKIGLAIGNSEIKIASPFGIAKNINDIKDLINKEEIEKIIVGFPLTMKNEQGENVKKVTKFINDLKKQTNIPITLIDERLSTKEAKQRIKQIKSKDDNAVAAMIILQHFFDSHA